MRISIITDSFLQTPVGMFAGGVWFGKLCEFPGKGSFLQPDITYVLER